MATIPKVFCFSLLFCFIENAERFIYNGFLGANLTLDGVAKVQSNGLLQLTDTSKQVVGHAFLTAPMIFRNSNFSFSTCFVFAMVPQYPDLGGHGVAFIISSSRNLNGLSQYLGLLNNSSINSSSASPFFAIELDSALNHNVSDKNRNHLAVHLNSLISVDETPASYYSSQVRKNITLELMSGKPMQVWIDYDGGTGKVNVTIAPAEISKPDRPLLSTTVNLSLFSLSVDRPRSLQEPTYVGFSAATGSISSYHYILGWSFSSVGPAESLNISSLPPLPQLSPAPLLPPPPPPQLPPPPPKNNDKVVVGLSIAAGIVSVVALVGVLHCIINMRRHREIREDWEEIYGPQRLSYRDLYRATNGFSVRQVIGAGGFGKVYRGTLPSTQSQVAVKKVSHDSENGMEQFVAEIAAMGRLQHRNLVHLVGYSRRKGELILVYDYMTNGSLDQYLFGYKRPSLSWSQRVRILRDVASALLYLHEEGDQEVLHRDIKSSNVLLDEELNGRLGDFGLAKLRNRGANAETTRVVGTVGYLAPEVSQTGRVTTKSDVYSFGVFMLEVACGRRPLRADGPAEEILLVNLVLERSRRGDLLSLRDPKLEGDSDVCEIEFVLILGLLCVNSEPSQRPTMRRVVQYLESMDISSLPQKQLQALRENSPNTFLAADESADPPMLFSSSSTETEAI